MGGHEPHRGGRAGRPRLPDLLEVHLGPEYTIRQGIYIRIAEDNFAKIPKDMEAQLKDYSTSWGSSLINEHMFNAARRIASHNSNNKLDPGSLYHALAFIEKTMAAFGRPCLPVIGAGRAASAGKLPTKVFFAEEDSSGFVPEQLDHLCSHQPDWPALGATNIKLALVVWRLAIACKGRAETCQRTFLNLLIPGGALVLQQGTKLSHLVLRTTPYSTLCLGSATQLGSSHGVAQWAKTCS